MKNSRILLILASFLLFSAGFTFFLTLYFQASFFTIINHSYCLSPLFFFLSLVVIFFLLSCSWMFFVYLDSKLFKVSQSSSLRENFLPYLPFSLFLFTPLLLEHYLNKEDLIIRLNIMASLVFLFFIYLKLLQLNRNLKGKAYLEKWLLKFSRLSLKKKLFILFTLAFVIYNGCAFILVSKGITFSGDEPYYLLTTHSLYQDKDINVANNYADKDYFHFYSKEQNPKFELGIYARAGKKGRQYLYSINLSGVSVLMLPYYWLSQFFEGKALTYILKCGLSIWAVLLGLQLYLFSREVWNKERISLLLWFLYSFTSPVLFYSIHIYPEIPIALFSFYIFRKVCSKNPLSLFHYYFLGFILSLFLWFGLKYNMIFWPLLLVSVYFLFKEHKAGLKIFCFLAFPLVSLGFFYLYIYQLYGSFYPFSIYEGVMTPEKMFAFKEMMLKIPVLLRIDTFLDFFLDQRDGLLLYSPIYFFSFLGLVEVFRRSKKIFLALLFISLPLILNYAFFSHRQGYCPQGRVLTPISWVGALLIGYFIVYNRKKLYSFLFGLFSLVSLVAVLILLKNPVFLYQPTTHEVGLRAGDMFVHLSNIYIFLPNILPSFIKVNNLAYLPNYFWILGIIAFVLIYIFIKKEIHLKKYFSHFFSIFLLLVFFFLWVLYPRSVLYPTRTFRYSSQKAMGFYLFPMGRGVVAKKMAEFYLHRENSYKILFSSRTKLEKIKFTFGSEKGEYEVRLSFFDLSIFDGKTSYEKKELIFSPSAYYPFKKLFLYEININLKKLSSESMPVDPYFFQVIPMKE
ncbi:MAG: hypothetical protein E3J76_04515 [Candidatus Aminicenantes bacterium]|nr:MAG: hypothetical protein E3J76_04515 [Candidatus Aminicenantes bacterium]